METKKHCNPFLRYSFYHFPSNDNYLSCKLAVYHGFAVLVGFLTGAVISGTVLVFCVISVIADIAERKEEK